MVVINTLIYLMVNCLHRNLLNIIYSLCIYLIYLYILDIKNDYNQGTTHQHHYTDIDGMQI